MASQNKFLESIIEVSKELDAPFLLSSATTNHHPIIYCSQEFSKATGFSRNEVTRKDVYLNFLFGRKTSQQSIQALESAVNLQEAKKIEMLVYDKMGFKSWYLIDIRLIKDIKENITFFLLLFNDITHLKASIPESPIRKWKRAVRKVLNKPDISNMFKKVNDSKTKRKKVHDMQTLKHKLQNAFIPSYGGEKIQLPKWVILHTWRFKVMFDILILFCILYTCTVVPFVICFNYSNLVMLIFDTYVDIMFLCDIGLTFFTTYEDDKSEIVSNRKMIQMKYLKSWFALDFIAAFPYSLLGYLLLSDNQLVLEFLRILKCLRLSRLGKVREKMARYMQMKTFVLGVWILFFCIIGHWMACIWYVLALKFDKPYDTPHSWLTILADISGSPYKFTEDGDIIKGSGPSNASLYISALYYTLSSLTTCGFGNIAPNTSAEKFFGCVTMLLGCVLYAFIFGQVTDIITQMQKDSNSYNEQIGSIKQFNTIYKVPPSVAGRLERYYKATWAVTKGTNEEDILKACPRDLQSDLCLHIHSKVFENQAFAKISKSALRVLSRYWWTMRTSPGDKIVYQGESVDNLYIIATGALEVKNGNQLVGLIGPGDAFGKRLVSEDQEGRSLFDIESCSFGAVHYISCDDVRFALNMYPEEYDKLKYDLVLSFDITRQIKIVTKDGSLVTTEIPDSMKEKEECDEINVYSVGDDVTALDYAPNIDVLAGMSELKGELRRETESMNAKMGVVEAQMRLILKLLRHRNKVDVDPEIGMQLDALARGQDINDKEGEWFIADSKGWKEAPPSTRGRKQPILTVAEKENDEKRLIDSSHAQDASEMEAENVEEGVTTKTHMSTIIDQLKSKSESSSKAKKESPSKAKKEAPSKAKKEAPSKAKKGDQLNLLDDEGLETISLA